MIKTKILEKLKADSLLLTQYSAKINKPFPTVKSWVHRQSSKLTEFKHLHALAELLDVQIKDLIDYE